MTELHCQQKTLQELNELKHTPWISKSGSSMSQILSILAEDDSSSLELTKLEAFSYDDLSYCLNPMK